MDSKKITSSYQCVHKNILWILFFVAVGTFISCEKEDMVVSQPVSSADTESYSHRLKIRKQFEPDALPSIPQPDCRI